LIDSSTVTITSKGEIYDFFIDRITFPIYDRDGMILGFTARATGKQEPKYLNSKETLIFNKSRVFFNAQNAFLNHPTILVLAEGPMDVIAIHRAGIKSVVGTMGVNCSDSQINMISNVPSIKTIVLAFDNDQAGINANIAIGQKILSDSRFGATNLFVIKSYDQKFKDLDELLRAKDAAYVKALIDQPIDFISYLITHQFTNVTDQTSILQLTNELLSYLVEHDDLLLKTTHLELLAKLSKINLADINLKYRELSDQKIAPSYARKSNIKIAVPRTAINSHTKTSTNPQIIK
jgi:DNA primase